MSLAALAFAVSLAASVSPDGGQGLSAQAFGDQLTPEQRDQLLEVQTQGLQKLRALGKQAPPAGAKITGMIWPLAPNPGFGSDLTGVSNFVDSNPAFPEQIRDYSCGTRSYDTADGYNHQGTDIFMWPFSWTLMDAGAIDIVAAADGVIVGKRDGSFDRECGFNSNPTNFVFVQHADGTVAWYLHMKNGSTTAKVFGDSVVAGEYLGKIGSSGSSTGPHLHFELHAGDDPRSVVIDPFNGACNSRASGWATQRPYYHSKINRLGTHYQPPSIPRCPQTSDSPNLSKRFSAGSEIVFAAYYADQRINQPSRFRIRRPDGSIQRSWDFSLPQGSDDPTFYAASYWYWTYQIPVGEPAGRWIFEADYQGSTTVHAFEIDPPLNRSNIYWNPEQPGWGLNLQHQGSLLYGTWYSYASDGQVMFLTIEASADIDGSFIGPVYRVRGIPLEQIDGAPAFTEVEAVGTALLQFDETGELTLEYSVDGISQNRRLQPFVFGQAPLSCIGTTLSRTLATNYSDLWWNPAEPGWGLTLSHQGDVMFALWYTYGESGRDQWISAAELRLQPDGSYRGALQRPLTGVPLAEISGAATSFPVPEIGSAELIFIDGENARISYQIGEVAQSKAITRFVVVGEGEALPLCGE